MTAKQAGCGEDPALLPGMDIAGPLPLDYTCSMRLLATVLASLLTIPGMATAMSAAEDQPQSPAKTASITLLVDEYPDYKTVIGTLRLPGVDTKVLEEEKRAMLDAMRAQNAASR